MGVRILDALDYLHSQEPPIIHRDIKPNNLKVTERGNIVLLDFGLAKETTGNTLGMRSVFGYSRKYSPLEQIEGVGTDTRSDIFSLGATLFHLLTGKPPVDVLARASSIVAGRPDPLKLASEVNENVPESFAHILNSAIALNADRRFGTAGAMGTALESAMRADKTTDEAYVAAPAVPAGIMESDVESESFAALEAFKKETEQGSPSGSEVISPAVMSSAGISHDGSANVLNERGSRLYIPIEPGIASRTSRAPMFWLIGLVFAAAALAFILLQGSDTVGGQSASAEVADPAPQNPAEKAEVAEDSVKHEPVEEAVETRAKTIKEPQKAEAAEDSRSATVKPDKVVDPKPPAEGKNRKIATVPTSTRPPAETITQRPKPEPSREYEQPPISAIETVLTGVPRRTDRREVDRRDDGDRPRRIRNRRDSNDQPFP